MTEICIDQYSLTGISTGSISWGKQCAMSNTAYWIVIVIFNVSNTAPCKWLLWCNIWSALSFQIHPITNYLAINTHCCFDGLCLLWQQDGGWEEQEKREVKEKCELTRIDMITIFNHITAMLEMNRKVYTVIRTNLRWN